MSYLDKEILHLFVEQESEDKSEVLQNILEATKDAKEPLMPVVHMLFNITGSLS